MLVLWFGLRTEKHLVRVRERSCFGLKYPFWSPQTHLEMLRQIIWLLSAQTWLEIALKSPYKYLAVAHIQKVNKWCCAMVPRWKHPVVSHFHILKCGLKLRPLALQHSALQLHHHPLHLLIWKSGHKQVTWMWYGTFCKNFNIIRRPVTNVQMQKHYCFVETFIASISSWWPSKRFSPILCSDDGGEHWLEATLHWGILVV